MLIAFNKPFGVLSQFTDDGSKHRTLAEFHFPKHAYPLGRLDAESEGLLLLSDEPFLNKKLLAPEHAHSRTYWAQVERVPTREALDEMQRGIVIGEGKIRPIECGTFVTGSVDPMATFAQTVKKRFTSITGSVRARP